ncbi:hypothetical protein ACTFIY_009671 [Dictyostelium cf. discoideum]
MGLYIPSQVPIRCLMEVNMDFISGLDTCNVDQIEYSRILVVVDRLSKFVMLIPILTHTSIQLAILFKIINQVLILSSSNLTLPVPLWLLYCYPITSSSTLSRRWVVGNQRIQIIGEKSGGFLNTVARI